MGGLIDPSIEAKMVTGMFIALPSLPVNLPHAECPMSSSRPPVRSGARILAMFRCLFGSVLLMMLATRVGAGEPSMDERLHIFEVVVEGRPMSVVSFLPREHVFSKGLAGPAIIGSLRKRIADGGRLEPDNIAINPRFVDFLHEVIADLTPTDPAFQRAAREQGEGWMYVIDRRTPTPGGHVPAEDILGGFKIENGAVVPGSYTRSPKHRLISERGVVQLDRFLHPKLIEALLSLEQGKG
jgi:hypothetical protein